MLAGDEFTVWFQAVWRNTSKSEYGYCAQTYEHLKVDVSTKFCFFQESERNTTCEEPIQHTNVDFINGLIDTSKFKDGVVTFTLQVNGARGFYLGAMGDRPGIDQICRLGK